MKFICEQCRTKYSISDEKVRRKILKIRCKTCGNVIVIRDPAEDGAQPAVADQPAPTQDPAAVSEPAVHPAMPRLRSIDGGAAGNVAVARAMDPVTAPKRSDPDPPQVEPAKAPASPDSLMTPPSLDGVPPAESDDLPPQLEEEWYLAVDGHQFGPMTFAELCSRVRRGESREISGEEGYVWRDGFDDWLQVNQVPDLRHYAPPPPPKSRSGLFPTLPPEEQLTERSAAASLPMPPELPPEPHVAMAPTAATYAPAGVASSDLSRPAPGRVQTSPEDAIAAATAGHSAAAAMPVRRESAMSPVVSAPVAPPSVEATPIAPQAAPVAFSPTTDPAAAKQQPIPMAAAVGTPTGLSPAVGYAPLPWHMKLSLLFGLIGTLTGVTLVIYFLWFDRPREQPELVRSQAIALDTEKGQTPALAVLTPSTGPTEATADDDLEPMAFDPIEVIRRPGRPKRNASSRQPTPVTKDTAVATSLTVPDDGLTAEQRRLLSLYKSGNKDVVLQQKAKQSQQQRGRRISPRELAQTFRQHKKEFEHCYNRALKRDLSLTDVKADVTLRIDASGIVRDVKLKTGNRTLTQCLKRVLKRWVFRPMGVEDSVTFPLVFAGS